MSDFEVVGEVAKRFGLYERFTNDRTVDEMIEDGFNASGMGAFVTYDEWKEKGYAVVPTDPDWDKVSPGMRGFHDEPEKHKLLTPSGKIEFFSQNLAKFFPDDEERPPVPHWIEKGVSHDERVSSERAKKYPLLMLPNHPTGGCMPTRTTSPGPGKCRRAKSKPGTITSTNPSGCTPLMPSPAA